MTINNPNPSVKDILSMSDVELLEHGYTKEMVGSATTITKIKQGEVQNVLESAPKMNLPRNSNLSKVLFEEVKKRAEKASKEGNYEYEDEDEDNVPTLAYSQDFGDSLGEYEHNRNLELNKLRRELAPLLNLFVLELNKKLEKAKTDKWQVLVSLRFIKTIFTKFTKEGIEAEDVYINIELMNMINLFIEASKEVMKNNRFVEILDDVPYSPEDGDEDESGLDILNKIIEDVKTFKEVRK